MKRRTLRIMVLLILGAATTVGIACGCASRARWSTLGHASSDLESWWREIAPELWRDHYKIGSVDFQSWWNGFGIEGAQLFGGELQNAMMPYAALRTRAGFPLLAFEGSLWYQNRVLFAADPAWTPQPWLDIPRALPLRPIWPGFLIDTLFYAAIWFGLFFGLAAGRRGIRCRRGRCPKCAYDLRGELNSGCPECGWGRGQG